METWFWILGWFLSLLTITGNKLTIFLGSFTADEISIILFNVIILSLTVADFCVVVERNSFSILKEAVIKKTFSKKANQVKPSRVCV